MIARRTPPRRGATLVESALIYPVLFLILFAIITLGIGVFRQQQVTHIAREASRWAAVHGADYAKEVSGATAADEQAVYDAAIAPQIAAMNTNKLTWSVTWPDGSKSASRDVLPSGATAVEARGSRVTVTVSYVWDVVPFWGPMTLSSTSTTLISY